MLNSLSFPFDDGCLLASCGFPFDVLSMRASIIFLSILISVSFVWFLAGFLIALLDFEFFTLRLGFACVLQISISFTFILTSFDSFRFGFPFDFLSMLDAVWFLVDFLRFPFGVGSL